MASRRSQTLLLNQPMTRYLALITATVTFLLPLEAAAKRKPAPQIQPVMVEAVKYSVPNDNGTKGYVTATEVESGKLLWKKTVYRVWICPLVEHDVQWVFIQSMRLEQGKLILVNERLKTYSLDLKTRKVRKIKPKTPP